MNKNSPYVILSEQICLVEIFVIPFIVEIFIIPFIVEIFFVPFIVEIFVQRFSDINQKNLAGMNFGAEILWRVGSSVPKHQYFF